MVKNSSNYPTPYEIYLFHQGNLFKSYEMLGAHVGREKQKKGVRFSVWAPHAMEVRVTGDFNGWQGCSNPMERIDGSGIWTTFIPGAKVGDCYKYEIVTYYGEVLYKADPYAFWAELRPKSASRVCDLSTYKWHDQKWQKKKKEEPDVYNQPQLIYEVHLGSWKLKEDGSFYTYRELADILVDYAVEMGYTHLELLPINEHPFDGSWGYQSTGYYAVTSRYGTPQDFMYFVDRCHQKGIGVILDWVPAHFCKDAHGLAWFDGTPLYESEEIPGWGTLKFDYGRPEVRSFLISNALFWFDVFHIDGLRVDAVASMLYLDYGKEPGQWVPNKYGGNGDLNAIDFIKRLNEVVFAEFPQALMFAEESTEWPFVTGPTYDGGLGFNFKWNMGWMNDSLKYMSKDPIYRSWHHNLLTFSFMYAFSENFVLPLSHDEVVHGKKSLIEKMPGDYWQKFANLRTFLAYMMGHPGKKLLFMGGEIAQFIEWRYYEGLEWKLLEFEMHRKFQHYVRSLNWLYRREKAFWEQDHGWEGFQWIDCNNNQQSILIFVRWSKEADNFIVVLCNFTPQYYENFRIGVPCDGIYQEIFNSDLTEFGGSGKRNEENLKAEKIAWHGQDFSLEIKVPPLACIIFKKKKVVKPNKSKRLQSFKVLFN
ncbi:MAG: 1,4-alpha-glucan branching protein GlgB [Clostridia bacterium]|jgi:1,4-alpha-glucan branching enzyme|nr:1,4-alpha-glucan branching protein GlgB [Clostridia bacterium]